MNRALKQLTYANVMSSIAVFLMLGGATAFAASHLGRNSVGSAQLKRNAVTAAKIRRNAVTGAKIKRGAVTGAKVKVSTLGTVPSATTALGLDGYARKPVVRVAASTAKVTEAETRAASPEVPLFASAPFSVYGKCFDFDGQTNFEIYVKTSENGAILASDGDSLGGVPFLDVSTAEQDRTVGRNLAKAGEARYIVSPEFGAVAPSGTTIDGVLHGGVKNGSLPGGNGLYGDGDVCLFGGELTTLNG